MFCHFCVSCTGKLPSLKHHLEDSVLGRNKKEIIGEKTNINRKAVDF